MGGGCLSLDTNGECRYHYYAYSLPHPGIPAVVAFESRPEPGPQKHLRDKSRRTGLVCADFPLKRTRAVSSDLSSPASQPSMIDGSLWTALGDVCPPIKARAKQGVHDFSNTIFPAQNQGLELVFTFVGIDGRPGTSSNFDYIWFRERRCRRHRGISHVTFDSRTIGPFERSVDDDLPLVAGGRRQRDGGLQRHGCRKKRLMREYFRSDNVYLGWAQPKQHRCGTDRGDHILDLFRRFRRDHRGAGRASLRILERRRLDLRFRSCWLDHRYREWIGIRERRHLEK